MMWTWGAVCRPKQHQRVSGDVYLVKEYCEGGLLAAVIDGSGNSPIGRCASWSSARIRRSTRRAGP
jgi:hypothetical protein